MTRPDLAQEAQFLLYLGVLLSSTFVAAVCWPYVAKHFWHKWGGPFLVVGALGMFGLAIGRQVILDWSKGTIEFTRLQAANEQLVASLEDSRKQLDRHQSAKLQGIESVLASITERDEKFAQLRADYTRQVNQVLASLEKQAQSFAAIAEFQAAMKPDDGPRLKFAGLGATMSRLIPKVVGGSAVGPDISATPWQVALVDGGTRNQFCGGTIVAEKWVLTAAHCVDSFTVAMDPKRVDVVAGTLKFASGGEQIEIENIHVHPEWRRTSAPFDFDAALLKLRRSVTKGKPIAMVTPDTRLPVGPTVRVTGWGATSEGGPRSEDLLFANVPVVSNDECNGPESYNGRVTDQMFCAGQREGGLDSCQGDSGGPVDTSLNGEDKVVGIVSWGFGCARRLKYGVYTRVTAISKWATDVMANN